MFTSRLAWRRRTGAMPLVRRAVVAAGTVLTLVSAAACGDDDESTGPSNDLRGTYALISVNGTNVPATLLNIGSNKFEVLSGSLELKDQSEFEARIQIRTTTNGEVETENDEDEGTWATSGNQVVLTSDDRTITGTVSGNTITITDTATIGIPIVLVFRR